MSHPFQQHWQSTGEANRVAESVARSAWDAAVEACRKAVAEERQRVSNLLDAARLHSYREAEPRYVAEWVALDKMANRLAALSTTEEPK